MTDKEALEALTSKEVVNPYLTLEALEIAIEALRNQVTQAYIKVDFSEEEVKEIVENLKYGKAVCIPKEYAMEEENMKDEDLKKLEAQIAQLTNALSDMVQKMNEHFAPLYDAVENATVLIEAQIADKPTCENCLYHDTEAGTDICKYWDEVPPAYTPCYKHKFKKPKED